MNNKTKNKTKNKKVLETANICSNEVPNQETELVKQNLRTLMQALCGCRKNCLECQEEERENG